MRIIYTFTDEPNTRSPRCFQGKASRRQAYIRALLGTFLSQIVESTSYIEDRKQARSFFNSLSCKACAAHYSYTKLQEEAKHGHF